MKHPMPTALVLALSLAHAVPAAAQSATSTPAVLPADTARTEANKSTGGERYELERVTV